jgi:putative phage-type endonuclease
MSAIVIKSTEGLSRKEWLELRKLGIGGSDAAVVCGVNRYKSQLELWMEKTGRIPCSSFLHDEKEDEKAGGAAYWGARLEPLIKEEFTRRTGVKVIPVSQIIRSPEYPFMLANLDGVCRCPIHGRCVFEAKTANVFKAGEWDGDLVPKEYLLQVQHYLSVTGYNGAYIAVLIGGNDFRTVFVPRDEEVISMLIRREADFWRLVQNDMPPPPDGSDACAEFLAGLYPAGRPKSKINLPAEASDIIHQYNFAAEQEGIFKAKKQEASNTLKQMLGDNEIGIVGAGVSGGVGGQGGIGYVKWKNVTQERLNAAMLKSEQPEIYERYLTESSYRRFSIKVAEMASKANISHKGIIIHKSSQAREQLLREVG